MINVYIKRPDDVILCNDEFFISNTYRKVKSDRDILNKIAKIEGVELSGDKIISKFTKEALHLNYLSTGCKTLLNVYKNPDKIFFIGECGDKILEELFGLENANFYIPSLYLPIENVSNEIHVFVDDNELNFSDTESLHEWWCNYES